MVEEVNSLECGGLAPLWSATGCHRVVTHHSSKKPPGTPHGGPKRRQAGALQGVEAYALTEHHHPPAAIDIPSPFASNLVSNLLQPK